MSRLKLLQLYVVLRMGMPLRRWLHGLTVIMEKETGNINIDGVSFQLLKTFRNSEKLGKGIAYIEVCRVHM